MQVIRTAEKVTQSKIPIEHQPRRPGDPPRLVASSNKIKNEHDWIPIHSSLEEIIESTWQWRLSYPKGYIKVLPHERPEEKGALCLRYF